jgi:hypothetical protein
MSAGAGGTLGGPTVCPVFRPNARLVAAEKVRPGDHAKAASPPLTGYLPVGAACAFPPASPFASLSPTPGRSALGARSDRPKMTEIRRCGLKRSDAQHGMDHFAGLDYRSRARAFALEG